MYEGDPTKDNEILYKEIRLGGFNQGNTQEPIFREILVALLVTRYNQI